MSGERLMDGFGLDDLTEDSEEDGRPKKPDDEEALMGSRGLSGAARLSGSGRVRSGGVEREVVKPSKGTGRGS
jgi:hypothetical protein